MKNNIGIFRLNLVRSIFLSLFLTLSGSSVHAKQTPVMKGQDIGKWIEQNFGKGKIPPFSFDFGGVNSNKFIKSWGYRSEPIKTLDSNTIGRLITYSDPKTSLEVTCTVTGFTDFHAVEWVLKFTNKSSENSPILEHVSAVDHQFNAKQKGPFIVHHANGSNAAITDFQPIDETLSIQKNLVMTPAGGRSSDHTAFPFFNLEMPDQNGVMIAIGWTGKWIAELKQLDDKSVKLTSGMERTKLTLLAHEEIRTPKICLLFWSGADRMVGHNQFRQFVLVHHTRKINGKHVELPFSAFLAREGPPPCNEHTCSTESFSVAMINRHKQFELVPEVFWLDAGWYPCNGSWPNVGNWSPNPDNFPSGFKPVTDAAHKVGAKFMLWFEPERVTKNTLFANQNPDWLIKIPKNGNFLFNLGNPEARVWLTDYISNFIKKEGLDYYRQDFNFDPMPYWKANDKPDRIGISEIRHIEGLYAFWDTLLERFPNLLIDNCSSGGRRLDLETISRSSPLWRTDYNYGEPDGSQCHTYGLNFYLPMHGTGNFTLTPYHFRSNMSTSMAINLDLNSRAHTIPELQSFLKTFKDLRPYYYGDYYPLTTTENMTKDSVWLAYQQNRPESGDGIMMAFRRKNCEAESITVKLRGLESALNYELVNVDTKEKNTLTGAQLMSGYSLILKDKQSSLLIRYQKTTL